MLRRHVVEALEKISHRTQSLAERTVLIFFVCSLAATAFLHLPERFGWLEHGAGTAAHQVEEVLLYLDIAGGLLYLLIRYLPGLLFHSPADQWTPPLRSDNVKAFTRWISGDENALPDLDKCRVEFVTPALEPILTRLNFEGFRDGPFGVELAELAERNRSWIAKNSTIFMLIVNPLPGEMVHIGFSSFVPLNESGARLYRHGRLKDAEIPAELVCGEKERPACVLWFAVMLHKDYRLSAEGFSMHVYRYFQNCIAYHLREMYKPFLAAGFAPPLLAQAELTSLRRLLRRKLGFRKTDCITRDGFVLFEMDRPFGLGMVPPEPHDAALAQPAQPGETAQ